MIAWFFISNYVASFFCCEFTPPDPADPALFLKLDPARLLYRFMSYLEKENPMNTYSRRKILGIPEYWKNYQSPFIQECQCLIISRMLSFLLIKETTTL